MQVSTYAVIAPARFLPGVEVVAVAARDSIRCQEFATHHKWVGRTATFSLAPVVEESLTSECEAEAIERMLV